MQALHLLALDPVAETTGDPNSYGFRIGRCCADALRQCHHLLAHRHNARWVLEGDIKSCFDKVRHDPQAPEAYGARITYDIPLRRAQGAPAPVPA